MKKLMFMVVVALLLPMRSFADHYADLYVIPVAGHVDGLNGTRWVTDVAIQNFQATDLTVQLFFIESGENRTDNVTPLSGSNGEVTVKGGGSVIMRDVLKGFNGQSMAIGALLVGADRPFAVTSRAYSMNPSGHTVGQTVLPVRDFIQNTLGDTNPATAVAYVPGVIQNARFRTNVGFAVGAGARAMSVEVTVKNAEGAAIGRRLFSVPADTFSQVQVPLGAIAAGSIDAGGLEFRIVAGDGAVAPYASVIDNATADAVYVSGQFPPGSPFAKTSPSVFRALFDSVRRY